MHSMTRPKGTRNIATRLLQQVAKSDGSVTVLVGQTGQPPITIQPGEGK